MFSGKALMPVAGYNTASKEEKAKYDKKRIGKASGTICTVCSVMLCAMAYFGYKVDSGDLDEDAMLIFAFV